MFRFLFRFDDLLIILLSVQEVTNLEQFIDADYTNFIHVQNVYENILLRTLDKEVAKGERVLSRGKHVLPDGKPL